MSKEGGQIPLGLREIIEKGDATKPNIGELFDIFDVTFLLMIQDS